MSAHPGLTGPSWPLRTERLLLRPPEDRDRDAVFAYRSRPHVAEWLVELDDDIERFAAKFDDPAWRGRTLVVERDAEIIGDVMVRVEDGWTQSEVTEQGKSAAAELGWVLHPAAVGNGYATEAVREVLRMCFEDLGVRRVIANCFSDNERSWRLMERVGMRRETHAIADGLHRTRGWLDSYTYALLADEWRAAAHPEFLY